MSRYLEIKPGSISEVAKKLREDYEAYFKKELEKEGKSLASMTDAEKKAFFNRVDKGYNAKDEATSQDVSPSIANKPIATSKTTLVAAPGGKEKVIRIPVEKLADYKSKGYVEAEEFVPEAAKEPYAIGMAAAMKATGDKPPLKKSTIIKAHDIAKKIEKSEEVEEQLLKEKPSRKQSVLFKKADGSTVHKYVYGYDDTEIANQIKDIMSKEKLQILKKQEPESVKEEIKKNEELTAGQKKLPKALQKAIDKKEKNEDVDADKMNKKQKDIKGEKEPVKFAKYVESTETIEEAGMKAIDTDNQELKRLRLRLTQLRDSEKAAAGDDTTNIEKQIHQTRSSILDLQKKQLQKQEDIDADKMNKKQKEVKGEKEPIKKIDEAAKKVDVKKDKKGSKDVNVQIEVESKKPNYKSYKKSLKKEEENPKNMKKTLTGQPVTKIDVEPKLAGHN